MRFHTAALLRTSLFLLCQTAQAQSNPPNLNAATAEDHRDMMEQLGIRVLRPGPSGNENAPNHANYDESKANPFPNYPEILRLNNGRRVTTAGAWWKLKRPQIVEDFEREVIGRVPANAPKVTWSVVRQSKDTVGPWPVIARELKGHVDNSAFPAIDVNIQMVLVTPAWTKKAVPVMMMFGRAALPSDPAPAAATRFAAMAGTDPPATVQLIGTGWGYALLNPGSVQADNGAGLTKGVIGLVNQGQRRKPDDWGTLRAWAWGASRALDYLETDAAVDARRVGIEGVSRYGKAALVAMAFDTRFAAVLVGSSGEGGAKPHRRNFGEAVENLTGSGQYHWMAGNFLKYGAAEATFGSRNAGDIPVDSHQLIALCAPRPVFISYGIPEKGDAKWLDQQGSFMATVAAGEAFRLLGVKDLGVTADYRSARMPAVNTALLDGALAWRQHDGGHTDGPNWKYFIPWASKQLGYSPPPAPAVAADVAAPRLDANSLVAHAQLLEKAKSGRTDVYFLGDSIVRRWGATDYPELLANWRKNFHGWNAANFGWGADRTQNILWRIQNGELEGVNPKVVVLLAGTNNVAEGETAADVTRGIQAIIAVARAKAPAASVIVTGIFPRGDRPSLMPVIHEINAALVKLADGDRIRFLDINDRLVDAQGKLLDRMMNADKLHPSVRAYQIWADALKPALTELLGPPAVEDRAPPPTGDPSAVARYPEAGGRPDDIQSLRPHRRSAAAHHLSGRRRSHRLAGQNVRVH
jgi:lysophospholipase L1-like esterase